MALLSRLRDYFSRVAAEPSCYEKCPYCYDRVPANDYQAQAGHMKAKHQAIIDERLEELHRWDGWEDQ